jgi:hypothetical protein
VRPHGLRISSRCTHLAAAHSSQHACQNAGKRSFPLDFRKTQFSTHSNTESSSQASFSRVSCSPACLLLPKPIWICFEFFVYARAMWQRSSWHGPKMEGEGGEVSQSFVWNRCRETVPPCRVRKGAFCFVKCFFFGVLKVFTEKLKWFLCLLGNHTRRNT